MKVNQIAVISAMYGPLTITNRMVFSVLSQFISEKNPYKIELILVDDYIEKRGKDNKSPYDIYVSDSFKKFYDTDKITIKLIKNDEHKYQGESREIGYMSAESDWFVMIDCDDMLAPNSLDRYVFALNDFYNHEMEKPTNERKQLAFVYGMTYGFDTYGYTQFIEGHSIWIQGRCYNRRFIKEHDIHFGKGLASRQGEDYPFMRMLDYALNHNSQYLLLDLRREDEPMMPTCYWFPNENSLSRKDPHYSQHLAGWTMNSSNMILDYFEYVNDRFDVVNEEDEIMKHEVLQMNVYAFYNLLDFLHEVSVTDYEPLKEDWTVLRDNVARLRSRLKERYWDEIVYSDIEDTLYQTHHGSDCHFIESWIGNFYDYINNDVIVTVQQGEKTKKKDVGKKFNMFDMSYDEMILYSKSLKFDEARHEVHMPQVVAWEERHK